MIISLVLRTSPRTNQKERPSWFSKAACAASLLDAMEAFGDGISLTIAADGGLPDDTAALFADRAQVDEFIGGNNRRSFQRALSLGVKEAQSGADVVWFCEDDYLYTSGAFRVLADMVELNVADYFSLYSPDDRAWHASHKSQPLRRPAELPGGCLVSQSGRRFVRGTHTTSTYGVTSKALLTDRWFINLATYSGGPFAYTTLAGIQGVTPFRWPRIHQDLNLALSFRSLANSAARPAMRAAVNIGSVRMRSHGRVLLAPVTDVISHVESAHLSPGREWHELGEYYRDRVQQ